jgi:hypothetical protein
MVGTSNTPLAQALTDELDHVIRVGELYMANNVMTNCPAARMVPRLATALTAAVETGQKRRHGERG